MKLIKINPQMDENTRETDKILHLAVNKIMLECGLERGKDYKSHYSTSDKKIHIMLSDKAEEMSSMLLLKFGS